MSVVLKASRGSKVFLRLTRLRARDSRAASYPLFISMCRASPLQMLAPWSVGQSRTRSQPIDPSTFDQDPEPSRPQHTSSGSSGRPLSLPSGAGCRISSRSRAGCAASWASWCPAPWTAAGWRETPAWRWSPSWCRAVCKQSMPGLTAALAVSCGEIPRTPATTQSSQTGVWSSAVRP